MLIPWLRLLAKQDADGGEGAASSEAADEGNAADEPGDDEGKTDEELWAEADQAETDADSDDDQADDDEPSGSDEDSAGSDDVEAGVDEAAAGDAEAGADQNGDGAAPDKPAKAGKSKNSKDDAAPAADDPWKDAPPALREAYLAEKQARAVAEQRARSSQGRLESLSRQLPPRPSGESSRQPANGGKPATTELKEISDQYPELAPLIARVETQETRQAAADAAAREAVVLANQDRLLEKHPDAFAVAATQEFKDWLDHPDTPQIFRDAHQRNLTEIVDAPSAAEMIGRFKATRSPSPRNGANRGNPAGASERGASRGSEENNRKPMSGKRLRQLESAASNRVSGAGSPAGVPADGLSDEAMWEAIDREESRTQRRQRA